MATPQKPLDGRHVRPELLIAGQPQAFLEQVTNFTAAPTFDKIEQKVLGQTGKIIDQDPTGWKGSMALNPRTSSAIRFIDTYIQAKVNNLPIRIDIPVTITYRDGTSDRFLYPNVEIDSSDFDAKRGSAAEVKIDWETGEQRIRF